MRRIVHIAMNELECGHVGRINRTGKVHMHLSCLLPPSRPCDCLARCRLWSSVFKLLNRMQIRITLCMYQARLQIN